jgi:NAD(P)-dependent dehydrogenase (short-subunit alcohol dehydrogenase family)
MTGERGPARQVATPIHLTPDHKSAHGCHGLFQARAALGDLPGMVNLRDRVALVTGASRGAGRGIAVELGAAGATVYVTGRSTREAPADSYGKWLAQAGLDRMPGTIDDTADAVTAAGGSGIAVRCDHTDETQVRALIARIEGEHGKLDVLVNNAWGGHETLTADTLNAPFWDQPLAHWTSMFDHGVRNHVVACHAAAPLFVKQRRGLIVTTTFWDEGRYIKGNLFYDLAKATMNRLAFAVAEEMRPHGVTSLAVAPGWMRTEIILAAFKTDEANWHKVPPLARTETPRYLGRAVAALAADPNVHGKTGGVYLVGNLAKEYGFTDVDGRVIPPFEM